MFEIAYGIESGIAIQSAVVVVFSAYLETIQKIGDRMVCPEMFADGMFFYAAVRVGGSGCAMIDSDAGYRIQPDERTVVLTSMIVGTFHQCTLWENVAHFQIGTDRCMQVTQYGFASGGIGKSFHCFFSVYSCPYRIFTLVGFYVLLQGGPCAGFFQVGLNILISAS